MTLNDFENDRSIINPYIALENPEGDIVALNTGTFGRELYGNLINISDEKNYLKYVVGLDKRAYKVTAMIGKQDNPLDYEDRSHWIRGVRSGIIGDNLAAITLGHILEEHIIDRLPKSYEHLKKEDNV